MNETLLLKMNLLGGMNQYIIDMGDEDVWLTWIMLVPDQCTEDDLISIAEDDELWKEVCSLFGRLVEKN